MRVLLDTHTLLWMAVQPALLSRRVRALLEDPQTQLHSSAVSAYELMQKHRLGRLHTAAPLVNAYHEISGAYGVSEVLVTSRHCLLAASFSDIHRDPFDRILAAQSLVEDLPLLSTDTALSRFGARVIW